MLKENYYCTMPEIGDAWLPQNEIRRKLIGTIVDYNCKGLWRLEHNPLEEDVLGIHKSLREESSIPKKDNFHPSNLRHHLSSTLQWSAVPLVCGVGGHVFLSNSFVKSMCCREDRSLGKQMKDNHFSNFILSQAVWSDLLVKGRAYD